MRARCRTVPVCWTQRGIGPARVLVQQPGSRSSAYYLAEFVCDLQLHCEIQFTGAYRTGATTHLSYSHP